MAKKRGKENKTIIVSFKKDIYPAKTIKSSISVYKDLADFSFREKDDYFEVMIKNIGKDFLNNIKDEFSNYVLAEIKNEY